MKTESVDETQPWVLNGEGVAGWVTWGTRESWRLVSKVGLDPTGTRELL